MFCQSKHHLHRRIVPSRTLFPLVAGWRTKGHLVHIQPVKSIFMYLTLLYLKEPNFFIFGPQKKKKKNNLFVSSKLTH